MLPRRRNDKFRSEPFVLRYQNASLTTDTTVALYKVAAGRRLRIKRVVYAPHGTLAVDASHYFNLKLIKGASTVIANWSTATGQQGTLTSNVPVDLVLSGTDANRVVEGGAAAAGDVISAFFDETGTATMPAGVLVIEGEFVK